MKIQDYQYRGDNRLDGAGAEFPFEYSFKSFPRDVLHKNDKAYAVNVSKYPGKYGLLIVYGASAQLRTHLLKAIGRRTLQCDTSRTVIRLVPSQFHRLSEPEKLLAHTLVMLDGIPPCAEQSEHAIRLLLLIKKAKPAKTQLIIGMEKSPEHVRNPALRQILAHAKSVKLH